MKSWRIFTSTCVLLALFAGCSTLDEKQRAWIFQPSDRSWGGGTLAAEGMENIWINFKASSGLLRQDGRPVTLHGLWLAAEPTPTSMSAHAPAPAAQATPVFASTRSSAPQPPQAQADTSPVLLYLHGARYNVTGSAPRIRRMQELGFSVLAIDYRGFGKSTHELPSESSAYEDARAAWDWLAKKYPDRARYIFGHSLGGPIAINLATEVADESGTIVEGTFTSIADVVSTSQWGWLPVSLLITQRFEAVRKVANIGSPLLVVHGEEDRLILPDLGRKLYEAAAEPKQFVLVEGGSHHNTNQVGQPQYREALAKLMNIRY